nr:uncharacterized protein LOC113396894 [Vanessa tameamea]
MEAIRLFLLKIILSAIVLNIILAGNTMAYNTISSVDRKSANNYQRQSMPSAGTYKRNWSLRSKNTKSYTNVPPYLVFNQKVGAYYPYYKYPYENNIRRTGTQRTRQ